jgi:F-type H+-transporting ATPase subunit a
MSRKSSAWLTTVGSALFAFSSLPAFAAGGGSIKIVSWYGAFAEWLHHTLGLSIDVSQLSEIVASGAAFVFVTLLGLSAGFYKLKPESMSDEELLPPKSFGFRAFVELCWGVISSTLEKLSLIHI